MTAPKIDPWQTCDECRAMGRTHVTREELASDPVGTWRREWRSGAVAVRWHDHPCDALPGTAPDQPDWPKAWAMFGPWGVDELPHSALTESDRITPTVALSWFYTHTQLSDPPTEVVVETPWLTDNQS